MGFPNDPILTEARARNLGPTLGLLAVLALHLPALAQQEAERLEAMAGTWDVAYEIAPGPSGRGGSGEGTMTARRGPAGNSLILDFESDSGPTAGFRIHQIIAWNTDRKAYDVVWVDSFNPGVIAAEGQARGDEIVYSRESVRGGVRVVTKGVVSAVRSGSFTITSFLSLDGGPDVETMTLTYRRRD